MRLLTKVVCCANHTVRLEFYDTVSFIGGTEVWTLPLTSGTENDFREHIRRMYVVFTDTLGEIEEGAPRLSESINQWFLTRAQHTVEWYGWHTIQAATRHEQERLQRRAAERDRVRGQVHFQDTPRRSTIFTTPPSIGSWFTGSGYSNLDPPVSRHHHWCEGCQKTRKCSRCTEKTKVRTLCNDCGMTATIRGLSEMAHQVATPPMTHNYRVSVDMPNMEHLVALDLESMATVYGNATANGVRIHSGNTDPQT